MKLALVTLLCVACSTAIAQAVVPIKFEAQALMNAPRGKTEGCGVRFVGTRAYMLNGVARGDMIDGSINTFSAGFSAVKAGWVTVKKVGETFERAPSETEVRWLRVAGQEPLLPDAATSFPSEDPGFRMYVVDFGNGLKSAAELSSGAEMQITFADSSGRTTTFSGRVAMSEAHADEYAKCLDSLQQEVDRPANR